MRPLSPLERLQTEPHRFGFDAAVRALTEAAHDPDPANVVRFRSVPNLAYPPADVLSLQRGDDGSAPRMVVSVMSLAGPSGVLPRLYSEAVTTTLRNRSHALHDFLDLMAHRLVALFARAGTKYRLHRAVESSRLAGADSDPLTMTLLSFTGHGTRYTGERVMAGIAPLLYYSGLFTTRPRSAERLRALISDWLGRPVTVLQFAGAWLPLPPDQRTRLGTTGLPGRFDRLGGEAAIGVRAWDVQARVVLRIGPLSWTNFCALLPSQPTLGRLVSLVRAYLGFETGFAINPVLARDDVPPLRLSPPADAIARLGWNTWLTGPRGSRARDGDDALFEAEIVEAQMAEADQTDH